MAYQSQREKIKDFLDSKIVPLIKKKGDMDYSTILDILKVETQCSENIIKSVLDSYPSSRKVKEVRIWTINDKEVPGWMKELREQELLVRKAKEEADQIIGEVKNG